MRNEQVVMKLIKDFALDQGPIRAIIMNGSRINVKVEKDLMQDYDIVYVVTNTLSYIEDKEWIKYFGEVCIIQEPNKSSIFKDDTSINDSYTYLIQFKDGIRIDVTFKSISNALSTIYDDKLTKVLLDKDNILPRLADPTDEDYILRKPTLEEFRDCCNEFWWVSLYVAKGLYRNELLYAMDHINFYVRPMLLLMLAYKAGFNNNYNVAFGKNYKYLPKYLDNSDLSKLEETYTFLDYNYLWDALDLMQNFFKDLSLEVGKLLAYNVDINEVDNTLEYTKRIKNKELEVE